MTPVRIRPTRVEVSLAALKSNLKAARTLAGASEVMAIVKANAYGHGAPVVAQTLAAEGVKLFGVALVEEALELRRAGIAAPILVVGGAYSGAFETMVEEGLIPTVFQTEHIVQLAQAARKLKRKATAHLKLDTGMGRIGVLPEELDRVLDCAKEHPEVVLDGLSSHFANADLADRSFTQEQVRRFQAAHRRMEERGFTPSHRHLANSAGVMELPEVRDGLRLNLVRPGLMLYGMYAAEWLAPRATLSPVLSWKTEIIHLKTVPAGTPISYGGTWKAPRTSRIATLPIGYADGYSRDLSNKSHVLVQGRRVPLTGRVCMDLCMVDVTDVPTAQVGDEVVLLGSQGSERISAEEMAKWVGTINYEIVCAIGSRVPRVAVDT